jgi:hypothetical protein
LLAAHWPFVKSSLRTRPGREEEEKEKGKDGFAPVSGVNLGRPPGFSYKAIFDVKSGKFRKP